MPLTCAEVAAHLGRIDTTLPMRHHLKHLTRKETFGEGVAVLDRLLLRHDIPTPLAVSIVRHFLEQCGDHLIATPGRLTPESRDGVVDVNFFVTTVTKQFMAFVKTVIDKDGSTLLETVTQSANNIFSRPVSECVLKNQRRTQEDRHVIINSLADRLPNCPPDHSMYAVFDGHGTDVVAQYAATHAPLHLRDAIAAELDDESRTMRRAFDTLDEHIADMCRAQNIFGGCTAVVCHLNGKSLTVGWCGDSHAVLITDKKARTLTKAHSPDDKDEYARVLATGGQMVVVNGELRVQGVLNLTRSFGDLACRPCITAEPSVVCETLTDKHNLLVVCCDGVYDALENDVFSECCAAYMSDHASSEFSGLANCLCELAIELGATDNLTCMVIALRPLESFWPKR